MTRRFFRFLFLLSFLVWGCIVRFSLAQAADPAALESARRFMQQEQWDAANFEWRRILETEPENIEATVGLAVALLKTGFAQEAVTMLEAIPPEKRVLTGDLTLGRAYAALNNWDKSREINSKIILKLPFQIDAFRELLAGREHLSGAALQSLESDLKILGNAAQTQGEARVKAKKYGQALNFYEIAASSLKTVGLVNDYGMLLLLQGQYAKAHEQFTYLKIKDQLKFSEVDSNAAIASLSIGKLAEAKMEIQEAINACRDKTLKAKLYNNMGYIYEMTRRRTDAKFAYQHAIELDPALTIAQLNLAYVQQADREFPEAIANYQAVLRREPKRADVWGRLGFVYELQYKSRPALAAYKKAVEIDPRNKEAYYNLATLYKKMSRLKEANAALKKVAEMNYQEIEAGKTSQSAEPAPNKLLKFVVLFPSNPKILGALQ
jgi:tetratricopeptide (TPR) repeat protein